MERNTISKTDAEGILASPQFRQHLRPIERLNPIRMPVIDGDGRLKLLPEGYDPPTKSFTFDSVTIADGTTLADARRIIDEILSEFTFADDGRSKAVAVAAMLTVFGRGLLNPQSLRPCFIYVANAEGAGKGLLVKCAVVPVLGYAPVGSRPKDDDEMRKALLAAVMEARPVILLDNVKQHLSSESLEGFLTAQHCEGRILGQSKLFVGENNAVVFVTGNGCTVSPDMRRRSLFAELFLAVERAEDRVFKQDLEVPLLLERRKEIVSALWSFIAYWDIANRPKPSRVNSSFTEWSNVIGGIVEHVGYGCPVETPKIESAADTDGEDVRSLVAAICNGADECSVTFAEMADTARANGLFERMVGAGEMDKRDVTAFSRVLKRYDKRLIGDFRLILVGKGHSRRYEVRKVKQ